MSILIRNLPKAFSEAELSAMFEPFGEILKCDLVMDKETGLSKGFGFVEMAEQDATDKAIATLNGQMVEGQKIRVKWSNQEDKRPSAKFSDKESAIETKDYSNVWEQAKSRIPVDNDNE